MTVKKQNLRKVETAGLEVRPYYREVGLAVTLFFFFLLFGLCIDKVCAGFDQYVWEQIPLYSAQYKPRKINEGFQMTHALAYAPSNPSHVYLCTDTSRVWRSLDGGEKWQQASDGMLSNGCRSLLVDPVNPSRVIVAGFLGVKEALGRQRKLKNQGLYLTEDAGDSWQYTQKANFYRQVSKSALLAYDSSSVKNGKTMVWYAGDYDVGLYKSSDGGNTWELIDSNLSGICAMEEIPDRPGELIIATESGAYLYDKQQMIPVGKGLPDNVCSIVVYPNKPGTFIAAAGEKGIYRSVDGGITFKVSNAGLPLLTPNITSLAVSKNPPYTIYAKSHKSNRRLPFFSSDGGLSWNQGEYAESVRASDSKRHFWFSSVMAPHPVRAEQCLVVSSGDGKVFKTDDGGKTWGLFGAGYTGARVMGMSFDKQNIMLALTDFGLWIKNRNETYYNEIRLPKYKGASSVHLLGRSSGGVISTVGTWRDQCIMVRSPEGRWQLMPEIHGRFHNLSVNQGNPSIIFIDNFRSLDNGRTWGKISYAVSAISRMPMGRIFALESVRNDQATQILYSDDKGESWSPFASPAPLVKKHINQLVTDPHSKSRLYIASNDGIFIYDGQAWKQKSDKDGLVRDQFGLVYVSALIADPSHPGRLMAGRAAPGRGVSNGVFQSVDGGETWSDISGNLGQGVYVWSLHFDQVESALYAGTDRGLMKLTLDP